MSEFIVTRCLVINRVPKEKNINLTLLSDKLGKISATASGAQKINSRRLGQIQLGNIINAHLYRHQNNFWLSEVTAESIFLERDITLAQSNLLFLTLEILNRLLPFEQNQPQIFTTAVKIIADIKKNSFAGFIFHEINLLYQLGFGPPEEITAAFGQKKYRECQQMLIAYLESIADYHFQSPKLW